MFTRTYPLTVTQRAARLLRDMPEPTDEDVKNALAAAREKETV